MPESIHTANFGLLDRRMFFMVLTHSPSILIGKRFPRR